MVFMSERISRAARKREALRQGKSSIVARMHRRLALERAERNRIIGLTFYVNLVFSCRGGRDS